MRELVGNSRWINMTGNRWYFLSAMRAACWGLLVQHRRGNALELLSSGVSRQLVGGSGLGGYRATILGVIERQAYDVGRS